MVDVLIDPADDAVLDMDNFIGLVSNTTLVRHDNDGLVFFLIELLEQFHHLYRGLRIKRAGRLIGEDHTGIGDKGTGNGHTLLLSARHLIGIMLCPRQQFQTLKILHGHLVAFAAPDT